MKPIATSADWFETAPSVLQKDPEGVLLIVRVGMALNALTAHARLWPRDQQDHPTTVQNFRTHLLSLATSAALTHEAIVLINQNFRVLKAHADRVAAGHPSIEQIGRLCGGSHPATAFVARARNQLVIH